MPSTITKCPSLINKTHSHLIAFCYQWPDKKFKTIKTPLVDVYHINNNKVALIRILYILCVYLSWFELVLETMLKTFSLAFEHCHNETTAHKMAGISHSLAVSKTKREKLFFNISDFIYENFEVNQFYENIYNCRQKKLKNLICCNCSKC